MSKQAIKASPVKSIDAQLTEYLVRAEESLIDAIKLLSNGKGPDRTSEYAKRLTRAQELVTGLLREELVRKRGPLKRSLKIRRPK